MIAGLAALLLVTPLSPTAGSEAAPAVGAGPTLTVQRAYGAGPVLVPGRVDHARVRFRGHAGDRVDVTGAWPCRAALVDPGGTRVAKQPSGLWRLPGRGTYTVDYHRCAKAHGVVRLQLVKLVVQPLRVDGKALRLSDRTGYLQAAAVRLPASGRVQLAHYDEADDVDAWEGMVLPDGHAYSLDATYYIPPDTFYVEAGLRIAGPDGPLKRGGQPGRLRMEAGDRLLLLAGGAETVQASTAVAQEVTVDGPSVTVSNGAVPFRETQLDVDGVAGQWVYLEQVGGLGNGFRDHVLIGPSGRQLRGPGTVFRPYWRLPVTGHYRIIVKTGEHAASANVRVRTLRQLAQPMPEDGTPLTFTTPTPGEWLLTTFEMDQDDRRELHAVAASTTGSWAAVAEPVDRFLCVAEGPLGCGDFSYGSVDPEHLVSGLLNATMGTGSWAVLVAMPPGQTGSVTLSLVPTA